MSVHAIAPGIRRLEVRTPTLPPATTTNVVLLGRHRLTVVDPASPWPDEQARLAGVLEELGGVERILLTHHHVDHVGGVEALRQATGAPVVAHPVTARLLEGEIAVDETVGEGDLFVADGLALDVLHTPGHAPGHVVLHDRASGVMVAGDMVAGVGTILIDPVEGDLGDYLDALVRMQRRRPTRLVPSHGPVIDEAEAVLGFYVAHRHMRSDRIREALDRLGEADPAALVGPVYGSEIPPEAAPFAAIQIHAHLRWLAARGLASDLGGGRWSRG